MCKSIEIKSLILFLVLLLFGFNSFAEDAIQQRNCGSPKDSSDSNALAYIACETGGEIVYIPLPNKGDKKQYTKDDKKRYEDAVAELLSEMLPEPKKEPETEQKNNPVIK